MVVSLNLYCVLMPINIGLNEEGRLYLFVYVHIGKSVIN
jgi:hypothetical protein